MRIKSLVLFVAIFAAWSCIKEKPLPILGERDFNGKDTVYHTIGSFQFVDQDSTIITNETVRGKIYVADFFFTSCRTICPIMKSQMLRIYQEFKNNPQVLIISHTIDPEYDTVGLLKNYAERLGVTSTKWHFLTGDKDAIYAIAEKSYFTMAKEDQTEEQGFIHSGAFLLVDKQQRIRGQYDGTKEVEVDRLIQDIKNLSKRNKLLERISIAILLISSLWPLISCSSKSSGTDGVKFTQYYNKGEQLYFQNCSNCHQKDGAGLGLLYPPLKDSDFLKKRDEVICIIKNGKTGAVVVNGKTYSQNMPAMPTLTNLEIAEISTYIYNTWSSPPAGLIDIKQVSSVLEKCN